jgi:hypothetical protein
MWDGLHAYFVYMEDFVESACEAVLGYASVELSRSRSFSRRRIEMDLVDLRMRRRGFFLAGSADGLESGQEESPEGFVVRVRLPRSSTLRQVISVARVAVVSPNMHTESASSHDKERSGVGGHRHLTRHIVEGNSVSVHSPHFHHPIPT